MVFDYADGLCRDVNFEGGDWVGVSRLLAWFQGAYPVVQGHDHEGADVVALLSASAEELRVALHGQGYLHYHGSQASGLIKDIQVFVGPEEDGSPFVEITFFPEYIDKQQYTTDGFVALVDHWRSLLRAVRFFVRYENASWELGDTGAHSGVIFTSDDIGRR